MKLTPKTVFHEFVCPKLNLSLGHGHFLFVDKELVGLVEAASPRKIYVLGRILITNGDAYFVTAL